VCEGAEARLEGGVMLEGMGVAVWLELGLGSRASMAVNCWEVTRLWSWRNSSSWQFGQLGREYGEEQWASRTVLMFRMALLVAARVVASIAGRLSRLQSRTCGGGRGVLCLRNAARGRRAGWIQKLLGVETERRKLSAAANPHNVAERLHVTHVTDSLAVPVLATDRHVTGHSSLNGQTGEVRVRGILWPVPPAC